MGDKNPKKRPKPKKTTEKKGNAVDSASEQNKEK